MNIPREPDYEGEDAKTEIVSGGIDRGSDFLLGVFRALVYLVIFTAALVGIAMMMCGAVFVAECVRIVLECVPGDGFTACLLWVMQKAARAITFNF